MDKFKDIADDALAASRQEKFDALQVIIASGDTSKVDEAEALAQEVDDMDAEAKRRKDAKKEQADKFAALAGRKFASEEDEPAEPEAEEKPAEEEAPAKEEKPAVEVEVDATAEAAGKTAFAQKAGTVATLAGKAKRPAAPETQSDQPKVLVAAAADTGFAAGANLDLNQIGEAAINRLKGMAEPTGTGEGEDLRKFGVATLQVPFDSEFIIDRGTDDMEVLYRASDERRLEGNSLVAANGWCSPSETLYDLTGYDESLEGILSVPEVQVKRGGIRYTMGPQFSDFYTNAGFIQTETQAIAGTTKPCYEVTCPSFTDVRLDAVGLCIKVPILLNAAYPEMTNRFVSGTMIAHEHMINANVIGRMVTASGAARSFVAGGLGSTANDSLEGLIIAAAQRRQAYRLPFGMTMEVVVPFYTRDMFRIDLQRRQAVGATAVTDRDVDALFAANNLKVSFVYDWQVLPAGQTWPTSYQALIYPAGTFVKGVSSVINLQAVYDAASLATNTYTGLFMEQGLLVARMKYASDLLTLPVCNAGRSGAANFTCASA